LEDPALKKLVVILLIAILALSFTIPALAAGPTVTARIDGNNANNGTLVVTVTDADGVYTASVQKPGNGSRTLTVGAYTVNVTFSGNTPTARIANPPPVIPNSPAPPDPGLPNNGGNSGQNNTFNGIVFTQYNNANFHCNGLGGNGRVWTTLGKNVTQKLNAPLHFIANSSMDPRPAVSTQANADTAWHLVHDKVYICEECGSAEWVTFSNNSGLPDGKNIQMNHPGQDYIIEKEWIMLDGDRAPSSPRFDVKWTSADGKKEFSRTVSTGKYFLPNDLAVTITERVPANFTLIEVKVNGEKIDGLVAEGIKGGDKATFVNKENPYGLIIKKWADGNPGRITARFDILNEAGTVVVRNAVAGTKYYLAPGVYTVVEKGVPGYFEHASQTLVIEDGKVTKVEFENIPFIFDGDLGISKIVEGGNIVTWLQEHFPLEKDPNWADILADMTFDLWTSNADGDLIAEIRTGEIIDFYGEVWFLGLKSGWYTVVENLGPIAEKIFEAPQRLTVEISVDPLTGGVTMLQSFGGSKAILPDDEDVPPFDFNALYKVWYDAGPMRRLGIAGLNGGGEIFPIALVNTETGEVYTSFCANGGSERFAGDNHLGCTGYLVANNNVLSVYNAFVEAFNYIEDKYGPLADHRLLTQVVTWLLLEESFSHGGTTLEAVLASEDLSGAEKAEIADVFNNSKGYKGLGKITDIVYLLCEAGHDYRFCQPQILALYDGKVAFENKPRDFEFSSTVAFNKVKYEGLSPINFGESFKFDLFEIVNGREVYVDTFETDFYGSVMVEDLEPGSYVFREVWALVHLGGLGFDEDGAPAENYNLVWKPIYPNGDDGLYFVIPEEGGDAVWPEGYELDGEGKPTVNNIIFCKHAALWAPDGFDTDWFTLGAIKVVDLGQGKGQIVFFLEYCTGVLEIRGYGPGIIWLGCSEGDCGIGSGIGGDNPCECDDVTFVGLSAVYGYVWVVCNEDTCGASALIFDEEMWLANGGWELPTEPEPCECVFEAVALAAGVGDGYVWWSNCEDCGEVNPDGNPSYDYDAWIRLGGWDYKAPPPQPEVTSEDVDEVEEEEEEE